MKSCGSYLSRTWRKRPIWRRVNLIGLIVTGWVGLVTLVNLSLHQSTLRQYGGGLDSRAKLEWADQGPEYRVVGELGGVHTRSISEVKDSNTQLRSKERTGTVALSVIDGAERLGKPHFDDVTSLREVDKSRRKIHEIASKIIDHEPSGDFPHAEGHRPKWDDVDGYFSAVFMWISNLRAKTTTTWRHSLQFHRTSSASSPMRHLLNPSLLSGSSNKQDRKTVIGTARSPARLGVLSKTSSTVSPKQNDTMRTHLIQGGGGVSGGTSTTLADVSEDQITIGTRLKQDGFFLHAYNVTASDALPLDRVVPDTRPTGCPLQFHDELSVASVSVVICTHNEATSVLRRTVASVFRQTPQHLLQEVIVVDDKSTIGDPTRDLEVIVANGNREKLRLLRTDRRQGLVRARLLGAHEAKGTVLVFLDSHCECGPGWLQPLLHALAQDERKVVSPYLDVIRPESYEYVRSPDNLQGAFNWRLEFGWQAIPQDDLARRAGSHLPIITPVISGGLFAVNRSYFFDLGSYDEQMDIWGGENIELSLRVWMCGGRLEIIPCSRVGHVFRGSVPYTFPGDRREIVLRNLARAANVWMDDYSRYFFAAVNMPQTFDVGDLSSRHALRQRLQCHSFQWYLKNVYSHLHIPSRHTTHYGQFKNKGSLLCLSSVLGPAIDEILLVACQGNHNQTLELLESGELQVGGLCVVPGVDKHLTVSSCAQHGAAWLMKDGHLQLSSTDLCVTSVDNEFAFLKTCSTGDLFQMWEPSYTFNWTLRR